MRRYKVYLVGGKVLEFEVKSARVETSSAGGGGVLVLRGEKESDRAEFAWNHILGYAPSGLLIDEEKP